MAEPERARVVSDGSQTIVTIKETGKYLLRRDVLDARKVYASALEIVSISVYDDVDYVLEPLNGVVASEDLAEGIRIDVYPKCGADGLDELLDWAGEGIAADNSRILEKRLSPGKRLFDPFAQRLLYLVSQIVATGVAFEFTPITMSSQKVLGTVLPRETYERNIMQGRYEIISSRRLRNVDIPVNQVIATTLVRLTQARNQLSESVRTMASDLLQWFATVSIIAPLSAIRIVNDALDRKPLDQRGAQYYSALAAALPVLYAVSRVRTGDILVMDVPLRLSMPAIFEAAIRNITKRALSSRYSVRKSELTRLYARASGKGPGVKIQPDIVVRPLARMHECVMAIDAKYKTVVAAGDHYEIMAYAQRLSTRKVTLVSLGDVHEEMPQTFSTEAGLQISIFPVGTPVGDGLRHYGSWIRRELMQV